MVSGLFSCLYVPMIASSFLCPTLQTHVDDASFNLDSSSVSIVSPCPSAANLGSPGREQPVQLSHSSDSLAVMSGFAVTSSSIKYVHNLPRSGFTMTFGLVVHLHAWQAEIGTFEFFMLSGFISCLDVSMIVFALVRPSTWTVQVSAWSSPVWFVWLFVVVVVLVVWLLEHPPPDPPRAVPPSAGQKISRFFFSNCRHHFVLFLSLSAASGPPGLHTTAREPKRAHFMVPAFKNTTKIQRKDPKRGRKRMITVVGEGKKRAKFLGGPAEGLGFRAKVFGDKNRNRTKGK